MPFVAYDKVCLREMDVEMDVDNVDICRLCKQNQGYGATDASLEFT